MNARRLTKKDEDYEALQTAISWNDQKPEWLKAMDEITSTQMDDLWETADDPNLINVGYFDEEGKIAALLVFRHTGGGAYELHLTSRHGFSYEQYKDIAWQWGWGIFDQLGATMLYAWIPEMNRVSRRASNRLCLTYDGVVRWHGIYRGRIVRWYRHTLYRETWLGWQNGVQTESTAGS